MNVIKDEKQKGFGILDILLLLYNKNGIFYLKMLTGSMEADLSLFSPQTF